MSAYGGQLTRYFARRAPAGEAEDLVQDVFLRLQSARLGGPIADAQRYLFAVARSVLVSRRRASQVRGDGLHAALTDAPEPVSELSPERILVARQDYARAIRAVVALPPRARSAFRLHRFEALTYGAIAERMGISRESVKELLRRASQRVDDEMRLEA
jgi:RNA polymerase sigma-70 factor (ECF subfamily)